MGLLFVSSLISLVLYYSLCPLVASLNPNPKSHWCPSIEVRKVACVKNVSLAGEPASMRRVYQWKRELIMRCCPGFMGPNCEKACFSCKQWAEIVGKVQHMEKYLEQGLTADMSGQFQPFTPDPNANTVCWTKDGRPVYAHFAPPGVSDGEEMPTRHGGRPSDGGGDDEIERSRIYVRNGAKSGGSNGYGCPIRSSRREEDEGGDGFSPYYSTGSAQKAHRHRQQQQDYKSIGVRRSSRQDTFSGLKSHLQSSAQSSYYQKHPPLPSNRKPLVPNVYEAGGVDVPEPGSGRSSAHRSSRSPSGLPQQPMKQIIRRRTDVTDEDIEDIRRRYSGTRSFVNENAAYEKRLSILERQMVELERKLSALSPALTNVASMKEDIARLTKQVEILQTSLYTADHDESSAQNGHAQPGEHKKDAEYFTRTEKKKMHIKSIQNHNSLSEDGNILPKSNESSSKCATKCKDYSQSPPLPDKDVVQALFPNVPEVADALDKGPEKFYEEVKRATKTNPVHGTHNGGQVDNYYDKEYRSDESKHEDNTMESSKKESAVDKYWVEHIPEDGDSRLKNQQAPPRGHASRQKARVSSHEGNNSRANSLLAFSSGWWSNISIVLLGYVLCIYFCDE